MYKVHDLPITWEGIEEEQLDPEVEKAIHDALNRPRRVDQRLCSISKLDDEGCEIAISGGRVRVVRNRKLVATGCRRGNLYYLDQTN